MKIGIPKAMAYYKYKVLWETFFKELGCDIIISDKTNKQILDNGFRYSIDESCLASKIYMGHVHSLINKCDYVFIPRFCTYKNKDVSCAKFNALYDICNNTFDNLKTITYNIDYEARCTEFGGFMKIGKVLGKNWLDTIRAYRISRKKYIKEFIDDCKNQERTFANNKLNNKPNILIVGHPYIVYDELLGKSIISYLEKLDMNIVYADLNENCYKNEGWQNFSKTLYWRDSKELLSGLNNYLEKVDGVIFISVFTCGPDSLVTEMCVRKIKNKPCINIVLDELNSDTGMHTRLESFTDLLNDKKKVLLYG